MGKNHMIWQNDRNFADDLVEDQRYYYVAESNDLIKKARYNLNANELKIIDFVISKIKPNDRNFNEIKTSMRELSGVLNLKRSGRTYNQIEKNIDNLRKKDITIVKNKDTIIRTGWFTAAIYSRQGSVTLEFDRRLSPFLLQLKNDYTQHLLLDTVVLSSKYSIRLYKLLRECDKDKSRNSIAILQGTPEEFKEWLNAPKSYSYGRLKDKILKPAINEINLKIKDMSLVLFQERMGKKVSLVEIHNNWTINNQNK